MKIDITELSELEEFATEFANNIEEGDVIFLNGDLGSGKTTFTQMLLKQLGYYKRVKSPTYAIYETYRLAFSTIIHMDLYRLSSAEELYYLAIDEIFNQRNIVIIEWPQKGHGVLPKASKNLDFELKAADKRTLYLDIT